MVCPSQTVTGKYAKIDHLGVALFKHYEGRVPTRSVFSIQSALPLKCPYPDIFQHPPNCGKSPPSISSMAMWQSSREGIGNTVKSLATRALKINLNKFPKFLNSGYEADTHVQTVEELTELSECYWNKFFTQTLVQLHIITSETTSHTIITNVWSFISKINKLHL